jgi:hypothetical protein
MNMTIVVASSLNGGKLLGASITIDAETPQSLPLHIVENAAFSKSLEKAPHQVVGPLNERVYTVYSLQFVVE